MAGDEEGAQAVERIGDDDGLSHTQLVAGSNQLAAGVQAFFQGGDGEGFVVKQALGYPGFGEPIAGQLPTDCDDGQVVRGGVLGGETHASAQDAGGAPVVLRGAENNNVLHCLTTLALGGKVSWCA